MGHVMGLGQMRCVWCSRIKFDDICVDIYILSWGINVIVVSCTLYANSLLFSLEQDLTSTSRSCDPLCSLDETSSSEFEATYQPKTDLLKALAVFAAAAAGAVAINQSWVAANQVTSNFRFSLMA